jgi:DNA-binding response OmpR family regulator
VAGLKNVLIVEDDVMIRELYKKILLERGYVIETAGSADELYSKLVNYHPDLIFLDVMLPGVSGLEILLELRKNPEHGCLECKIVILTNLAQSDITDNVLKAGADGYIIKADIMPEDLPAIITDLET